MSNNKEYTSEYELDGRVPLGRALLLGFQHVLAMFVGNITPILILCAACGLSGTPIMSVLIRNTMVTAGIITLIQIYPLGPMGARLPIVMGTSSGFIGVMTGIALSYGGGIDGYAAVLGASIVGGIFEGGLGFLLKSLRKLFPPLVSGIIITTIGLSLINVGVNSFGGGSGSGDFGSLINLAVASFVIITIIVLKHFTKGVTSSASIVFGIIAGYILCTILAFFIPTTYIGPDGQEAVCSWVVDWSSVREASWLSLPTILPIKPTFKIDAIIPMMLMFIVSAVETIGDISGIVEGGLGRAASERELSGGIVCDGVGSSLAALFGVLPNSSFSQNVGLIAMTKIVNRYSIGLGAVVLILCGFIPKISAIFMIMPPPVLGGAALLMFSSIAVSGISLMLKDGLSERETTIIAISLGLGLGIGSVPELIANLPSWVSMLCSGSGIVPAAFISILLNQILPKHN